MKEKTINDFLKIIEVVGKNGKMISHNVFDYEKMWEDDAFYFIIISERGRLGKTYGAKEFGQKMFLKNGEPFVYAKNLSLQIKKESKRFLRQVKDLDIFYKFEIDNSGVYKRKGKNKEYSCFFHSLNSAETDKGSRSEANLLILDEFMDGVRHLTENQTFALKSLLDTYSNPVNPFAKKLKKCFILGNFKTLNSRLLVDLGIFSLKKELTTIYSPNGNALIRILSPQYNKKQKELIEENLENEPIFEFGKITGQNEYSLFNENVGDILNNIKDISADEIKEFYSLELILYLNKNKTNNYIFIFFDKEFRKYHILRTDKYFGEEKVYNVDKKNIVEDKANLATWVKKNFIFLMEKGKITFDNVYTREIFIEAIVK